MDSQTLQTITGYVALAVPITVTITNVSKLALEWLNQRHAVKKEMVQQAHEITNHYLGRALDPTVPLAIRHQLLRFLATPDRDGSRLSDWAVLELKRVEVVVESASRAVTEAEKELMSAKTDVEVIAAEKKLAIATSKQQLLLEAPKPAPVSAPALRAGFIQQEELKGLVMKDSDLHDMSLTGRNLRDADFSGSTLTNADLSHCDLRRASFKKADLSGAYFFGADLRNTDFYGAKVNNTHFNKAHLEGADFTEADFDSTRTDLMATYDAKTKWPTGFDPEQHGGVKVES